MTREVFVKGLFALFFSGIFAWMVFYQDSHSNRDINRQRYLPYISGLLLPLCTLTILGCALILMGAERAMEITLAFCFGVFLHICLYYLLLMPALPFLRRYISARACAVLWMLPNYLYLTQMNYMRLLRPRWVIEAYPEGCLSGYGSGRSGHMASGDGGCPVSQAKAQAGGIV